MSFRVTNSMMVRTALSDVIAQQQRLRSAQEQASSGLKINRLADDPAGVRAATLIKAAIESTSQFERNIVQARTRIEEVEAALGNATDILSEAEVIAIQGANDTLGADERLLLASRVEALHAEMLSSVNRRVAGGYLFSGYTSDVQPFTVSGPFVDGGPAPTVSFTGDNSEIEIEIDEGVRVRSTLDGERVFLGTGLPAGEDVFDILADLRDALANNNLTGIQGALDRIETMRTQVSVERTDIGSIDAQLERFEFRHADRSVDLQARLSEVQDADSVEVFSDLVNQETALRASLDATARLLQPSLMDFLR